MFDDLFESNTTEKKAYRSDQISGGQSKVHTKDILEMKIDLKGR